MDAVYTAPLKSHNPLVSGVRRVAADALGLPAERIRFELGDTNFPEAPMSGASQTVASVGPAVFKAARSTAGWSHDADIDEIGITGVAAAIANTIYHATDKLLA